MVGTGDTMGSGEQKEQVGLYVPRPKGMWSQ